LVVRREKRGRAGKTVTRVAGLALAPEGLEELAGRLKRALGCGASVEAGEVLVQGDQVERCAAWLESELQVRVTLGN
jgi:translation initiation factor 1